MTKLTGTEKQIKWAEDIRAKFMENVGNATEDDCKKELEETGYPEDLDYDFFKKMIKKILEQTSAKWWIERMNKVELYDINMLAEDTDEESWDEFIEVYNI